MWHSCAMLCVLFLGTKTTRIQLSSLHQGIPATKTYVPNPSAGPRFHHSTMYRVCVCVCVLQACQISDM